MRVMTIFGTRPEAIKLAPVVLAFQNSGSVEHITCVTGQHREMLDQVLQTFDIRPDIDLDLMRPNQKLEHITSAALTGIGEALDKTKPDWVLVQGDTTTAFAGALAAFYRKVKVGHVEAGLRTGNIYSPWPEEMNRRLISQLTTMHFPPTEASARNLLGEGIARENVLMTGNTVIDALQWVVKRLSDDTNFRSRFAQGVKRRFPDRRLILVTGHRRENFDSGLETTCIALRRLADRGDVEIIYPVHLNPRVQSVAKNVLADHPAIQLLAPMNYVPFIELMRQSYLIVTDSGGIQEEAPGLGIPVLITRDTTERPEAVQAGTAKLIGTNTENLVSAANTLLDDSAAYTAMAQAKNPFGDGQASRRIVNRIIERS
ncbi:MAG TPA: UDP-N-acetylglucosamine 2-epimerase (non-hydrolyzing) [Rhizomicrobium sp.]|nr:UDP-N-acetylglucosamine 2-epimerase (non-hydrolyzing) [Rhizomicrobium sp.]